MKIFIIQPVRNITEELKKELEDYVTKLEKEGHEVHLPMRDTDQASLSYNICEDNRYAIKHAGEVHIAWDGKSQGCLFDLGMAFAYCKKIKIINNNMPLPTEGKSFQNMIKEWEK